MVDQPLEDLAAEAIAGELGGRACPRDVPGAPPAPTTSTSPCPTGESSPLRSPRPRTSRGCSSRGASLRRVATSFPRFGIHGASAATSAISRPDPKVFPISGRSVTRPASTCVPSKTPTSTGSTNSLRWSQRQTSPLRSAVSASSGSLRHAAPPRTPASEADPPQSVRLQWSDQSGRDQPRRRGRSRHNCAKLQRATADEHHLFIWVDPSIGAAGISIADDRLPGTGPTLPEAVTTVWLGFAHNKTDQLDLAVLWCCDNGGCWARDCRTGKPG